MTKSMIYRDRQIAKGNCPQCGKPNDYKYLCKACSMKKTIKMAVSRIKVKLDSGRDNV